MEAQCALTDSKLFSLSVCVLFCARFLFASTSKHFSLVYRFGMAEPLTRIRMTEPLAHIRMAESLAHIQDLFWHERDSHTD